MHVADTPKHTVRLTALRTGLTPHTLRAWERRHHVVTPTRTEGGQRLYSDLDVERLRLIRQLTERGHSIRRLANAALSELEAMRHYVRLSQKNYGIDTGLFPLGSCTMKHNPRLNERMARLPGFGDIHPLQPVSTEGTPLGQATSVSIRSSKVGFILWIVMAVGGTALFVAIALRIWRRIRRRRRTHGPVLKQATR